MKFVDLFAGMGGFHLALTRLGHECVFASEIDEELSGLYKSNFPTLRKNVFGDIRQYKSGIPDHDVLCAGFPCQPFSKSGSQNGRRDKTRGTLFHEILVILEKCRPQYLILENVGNFEMHNRGRTWRIVRESLKGLGYDVRGTIHIGSGGHGLISPHHLGHPHHRERFFIVGSLDPLPDDPFPPRQRDRLTTLADLVQASSEMSRAERQETALTERQTGCINHWNKLLSRLPDSIKLPSFPIWGDEIQARYPYERRTPYAHRPSELFRLIEPNGLVQRPSREQVLAMVPSYARTPIRRFPDWKVHFIRQNREWLASIERYLPHGWTEDLRAFPSSLRKLEWNWKDGERDLWSCVLQFRPSGLRAKRYTSCPALVAMTTTQIPILGPKRRFITRTEGLRLQDFPDSHLLPKKRDRAFAALGNAVHVGVVEAIAERLLGATVKGDVTEPVVAPAGNVLLTSLCVGGSGKR